MKLKDDFYTVIDSCCTDAKTEFLVRFNPEHFIYASHFPNNPITPGVCIMQIVVELTDELTGGKLFLKQVKNIKFLQPIDPRVDGEVIFSIALCGDKQSGGYKVAADVYAGEKLFSKLSLQFITCDR